MAASHMTMGPRTEPKNASTGKTHRNDSGVGNGGVIRNRYERDRLFRLLFLGPARSSGYSKNSKESVRSRRLVGRRFAGYSRCVRGGRPVELNLSIRRDNLDNLRRTKQIR